MTPDQAAALLPEFARALDKTGSSEEACRLALDVTFHTISNHLGRHLAMALFLNYLADRAVFKDED